jgi:transglutaminase superfamily protein
VTVKGLSLRHVTLLARMLFWRVTLPVAKRFIATEKLVRLLATGWDRERQPKDLSAAVRIARRLWRSAEGPCLERSLALYHELGRLGAHPELVLGLGQGENGVVGHAWIEVDRRKLLEPEEHPTEFSSVARFDAKGARAETT